MGRILGFGAREEVEGARDSSEATLEAGLGSLADGTDADASDDDSSVIVTAIASGAGTSAASGVGDREDCFDCPAELGSRPPRALSRRCFDGRSLLSASASGAVVWMLGIGPRYGLSDPASVGGISTALALRRNMLGRRSGRLATLDAIGSASTSNRSSAAPSSDVRPGSPLSGRDGRLVTLGLSRW